MARKSKVEVIAPNYDSKSELLDALNASDPVQGLIKLWKIVIARMIASLSGETLTGWCIGGWHLNDRGEVLRLYIGDELYVEQFPEGAHEVQTWQGLRGKVAEYGPDLHPVGRGGALHLYLPLPGIQCWYCGESWNIRNAHDVVAQESHYQTRIGLFHGKTLAQIQEELLKRGLVKLHQRGLRLFWRAPISRTGPEKIYLNELEGGPLYVVRPRDRINMVKSQYAHRRCWAESYLKLVIECFQEAGFVFDPLEASVENLAEFNGMADRRVLVPLSRGTAEVRTFGGGTSHTLHFRLKTGQLIEVSSPIGTRNLLDVVKALWVVLEGPR